MADTPEKMQGVIVGVREEGGWVANMTNPVSLSGVELPVDALCLTKSYSGLGARTRITNHACPNLPVGMGDYVVAHVSTETETTGRRIKNPAYGRDGGNYSVPYEFPERRVVGATVTKWGLRPNKD